MKDGKLPENVLKRSVLRQFCLERDDVLIGAGIGADSAAVRLSEGEAAVLCTDPVVWTDEADAKRVVHAVCNDLACTGAQPVGLLLTALLPPELEEPVMRGMVQLIAAECESVGIQILGGHTEVTSAVNRPVISVSGMGKVYEDKMIYPGGVSPGDDILVTKWIGLEGTARIARCNGQELRQHFPAYMVEAAEAFDACISVLPEAALAAEYGVTAMHDVSEGGIFGALWELAESSGIGLEIDLKRIPIRQETIEICNFLDMNPYQLVSGGSMLMAVPDGGSLACVLQAAGIPAAVIGKAVPGNDRVILNEGERRFLERPARDEIHRVL
ncbi:MAG: AIR synthase family protein [Clostridiales bacterium]|nr:AIR synthase family protein [Clostridiales bacterium]MCD8133361.1 AIR synthase family protein [Clostridiales bacterium]